MVQMRVQKVIYSLLYELINSLVYLLVNLIFKEENYYEEDMIFSMKKPKDALDGFSKGAGNFFKGVAGGAALLVAAPIQGMSITFLLIHYISHTLILSKVRLKEKRMVVVVGVHLKEE